MDIHKIGVLTSGGDSPGMNAAVVAVARNAASLGIELVGIKRGFNGLLGRGETLEDDIMIFTPDQLLDIADLPGTYLKTARCNDFLKPEVRDQAAAFLRQQGIEGLVIIGGDGSFHGAQKLCELGINCIGIPGTIDNDLPYTEMTLGFDTALNVCVDVVRSVRATSRSHDRPAVVEVMGRDCGDIALKTAVSTGAEIVLVPEVPWKINDVARRMNLLIEKGNTRATVIVAEGCWQSMEQFDVYKFLSPYGKVCYPGEPMTANRLASVIKRKCGMVEARATVVGYTQRGCQPTARDSAFAFEAGTMAVNLLKRGASNQVIGVKKGKTDYFPIDSALSMHKKFNKKQYSLVNRLL